MDLQPSKSMNEQKLMMIYPLVNCMLVVGYNVKGNVTLLELI
jgi:hypothetical protein